jgi:hypothetical protein
MSKPNIVPIKVKEYQVKQSKYEHVSKLPTRSVINAGSGSGKTILIQNLILDVYRGCFSRIYIFSPSHEIDDTWLPVKKYIEEELTTTEDEQIYFDDFNGEAVQHILNTQKKVIDHQKKDPKTKKLFSVLIIFDDVADNKAIHNNSALNACFTRGRHSQISTILSTQKYNVVSTIIRTNMDSMYLFRLRNANDLQAVIDELSALLDKKVLLEVYHKATEKRFSFLFIRLTSPTINDMFMVNFSSKIMISDE